MNKFKELWRDILPFIKNVYKWRKILWNDRDFDYNYVLDVLIFKLEDLSRGLTRWHNSARWEKDVQDINTLVRLMKKYKEEYYSMEYMDYVKNTWINVVDKDNPMLIDVKLETIDINTQDYLDKHRAALRKMKKLIDNNMFHWIGNHDTMYNTSMNLSYYLQERAKKLVWKMIEQRLEYWWD